MLKKIALSSLFLVFFTVLNSFAQTPTKSPASNQINKISFTKSNNNVSLKFELKKAAFYKIFTLENPHRLVIDFEDMVLKAKFDVAQDFLFESFRSGKRDQSNLRVVFNLKEKIDNIKSTIVNPSAENGNYKLIIEFSVPSEVNKKSKYSLAGSGDNQSKKDNKDIKNDKSPKTTEKKDDKKKVFVKNDWKPKAEKPKIIVIDAGHGGRDPGAIGGYIRSKEKDVTLAFAYEIKKYLEKNKGFKVFLTRDDDYFISLYGRVKKSQSLKADLFISIHADSAQSKNATGLSIYTLSETSSDKEAERLANKENKSDIIGGVTFDGASGDIVKTLIDLSQRSTMNESASFAEFTMRELSKGGIDVKQNTHRFAGFRVLTAPDIPSVLIELGYLSNRKDEEKLNDVYYRRDFAKIFTATVEKYFHKTVNNEKMAESLTVN